MKTKIGLIILVAGTLYAAARATTDTHYVDINNATPSDPYTSRATAANDIQSAIDAASPSDIVLVADGTYSITEQIAISNCITLRSENGSGSVTINANGNSRGIWITDLAGPFGMEGFTITGGTHQNGGALNIVALHDHAIHVADCVLEDSFATNNGGGMYIWVGAESSSSVLIERCEVRDNQAQNRGGGIWAGATATATGSITIQDCLIDNNVSLKPGGGLNCFCFGDAPAATIKVDRCTISNNTADKGGGARIGRNTTMANSLVKYNTAHTGSSGGIYGGEPSSLTLNCTVVGNHTEHIGGGVSGCEVRNSIVYYNSATGGDPDIYQTYPVLNTCAGNITAGINGNINEPPEFLDPASGNYRLPVASPCVGAGSNSYVTAVLDLDRNKRIFGRVVDMGAYEGVYGCAITNCVSASEGFILEWVPCAETAAHVKWSPDLGATSFTNLTAALPFPQNSYTDTVHNADGQCFYRVDLQP